MWKILFALIYIYTSYLPSTSDLRQAMHQSIRKHKKLMRKLQREGKNIYAFEKNKI